MMKVGDKVWLLSKNPLDSEKWMKRDIYVIDGTATRYTLKGSPISFSLDTLLSISTHHFKIEPLTNKENTEVLIGKLNVI